ncbi:MAG: hypothetical protein ACRDS1_00090, partial [Pseudonocardiaceae bacterium]
MRVLVELDVGDHEILFQVPAGTRWLAGGTRRAEFLTQFVAADELAVAFDSPELPVGLGLVALLPLRATAAADNEPC